ncbi:MAG: plasmid pRiA4b ORF-3 family protein [bacterium]|nr:plasmid pRiA4b ORF-3 family protein [bacterium]
MRESEPRKIIHFPGAEGDRTSLVIRVDLLLMPAPVWRRLEMPGACTFWDLHVAIQDAFGWRDRHLHQFTVDETRGGRRLRLGVPDDSGFHGSDEILPGWEHRVTAYLRPDLPPSLYTYDFGDEWQHEVGLERIAQTVEPSALPRCLDGAGLAPPEDCGGPPAVELGQVAVPEAFVPEHITFENPRERWHRAFRHD